LHFPGDMIPGQLGPIKREFEARSIRFTPIISCVGIPSVIATITGMPASIASRIASAAKAGGTKIRETLAPSLSTAS